MCVLCFQPAFDRRSITHATAAQHLQFMRAALPFLDGDARVQRYAWMSGRDKKIPGAALFDGPGGQLTELGRFYIS